MVEANWDALRCFISVCKHESLTSAAKDLSMSVATLARRMDSLEAALGLRLMRRGPSGITLTADGSAILAVAQPGGDLLAQVARTAQMLKQTPSSTPVRISSTEPVIAHILAPHMKLFVEFHPGTALELEASIGISNLNVGASDIAVRMVKPVEDTLITRPLPAITMGLYCSQDYLKGRTADTIDLTEESLLLYDPSYGPIAENVWAKNCGLDQAARMRSGSVQTLMHAAMAGVGIALIPDFLAQKTGLTRVPSPTPPARHPWLVFHRDTRNQATMKAVRNWIVDAFKTAFTS